MNWSRRFQAAAEMRLQLMLFVALVAIIQAKRVVRHTPVKCKLNGTIVCPSATCPVEINFPKANDDYKTRFSVLGVGRRLADYYDLYPEARLGSEWLNTTLVSGHLLALYHEPHENLFGFRIAEEQCWNQLAAGFDLVSQFETVRLSTQADQVALTGYIELD